MAIHGCRCFQVVTGGGDSVLNVWGDVTSEVEEEEIRLAEELVQKEQALANFVYRKDYKKVRWCLKLQNHAWKITKDYGET
jgi:hypothetical protein